MSESPPAIPPVLNPAPPVAKTLRLLFLTLFLRGRGARGLKKNSAPTSVGSKLAMTLGLYALIGFVAVAFMEQPVFSLSIYLHSMTLVFLGMFVAASAGEVLFNKEEGDILMHRPITSSELLWAKIRVLVEVSLWLAGAFNLVGFFIGFATQDGGWLFPFVHALSTVLEALFCTSGIVIIYQLCLRWFGREKLEGVMTAAQVFVAVGAVLVGQIVPRLIGRFGALSHLKVHSWWICLLAPAWFAGIDDALAGSHASSSWLLAGFGLGATTGVLWLAFGKLARDYERGLQSLNEAAPARPARTGRRRWIDVLVKLAPMRWWLRNPISRASFMLTSAYLFRDRDVKLRIYPGVAPILVMPVIFLLQSRSQSSGFGGEFPIAFAGGYLGLVPLLALNLLQYSQQWQAADLFRAAPMRGPAPLGHGARCAVFCFITLPIVVLLAALMLLCVKDLTALLLLVPGLIILPLCSLVPFLGGKGVPLSLASEEAKSAKRGASMMVASFASLGLAGLALWARSGGWFHWMLAGEIVAVIALYFQMRALVDKAPWPPME